MTVPPAAASVVLMYHRVAEPSVDPWKLSVSPAHFAEQLEVLAACADVVPLRHVLEPAWTSRRPRVAITFDDGYVDNLRAAAPCLARLDLPATVFVATGYVGHGRQFWWDELADLLLVPGTLPATLSCAITGAPRQWDLGDGAHYDEAAWRRDRAWRAPDGPPTARHQVFAEVWHELQHVSRRRQEYVLNVLRAWSGRGLPSRPADRAVTLDELHELAAYPAIEIGAHTVTHPILKGLPDEVQRAELEGSKQQLEAWLDRPVGSFAYPYGTAAPASLRLVQAAGFQRACTTAPGLVPVGCDPFRVPRVTVEDWDGDLFQRHLTQWCAA